MDGKGKGAGFNLARRSVLRSSLVMAGGGGLVLQSPLVAALAEAAAKAHSDALPFSQLSALEADGLEAIAARIIPSDDTPGAREIGVIHFIDQSLGSFLAPARSQLLAGLADLDERAALRAPASRFVELNAAQQDALITEIENSAFFDLMHYLTVAGMFALPTYGGNRDTLGWKLLGFEQRHAWSPPFGHYDAQEAGVVLASTKGQAVPTHE